MSRDILVYIECRDSHLEKVGLELLGEARKLASDGVLVKGVVVGYKLDKVVETYRDFSKSLDLSFHEDTIKIMSDINKRYREIEEKLKGLERLEDELENNSNKLMELIKEKRKIIVGNTDEKQHRYKLEK